MLEFEARLKKWGNSVGITVPQDIVKRIRAKKDQNLRFFVIQENNVLSESFGLLKGKLKKTGQEMKDQARRELYG